MGAEKNTRRKKKLKKSEKGRKFNVKILTNKVLALACWYRAQEI